MAAKKTQSKKGAGKKGTEKKATGKKADIAILKNPRVTEKTANATANNVYAFDVAVTATKSEIAKAFEAAYKQVPLKVHTMIKKPKAHFRRTAQGSKVGFSNRMKKAYVYLPKGVTIDVM